MSVSLNLGCGRDHRPGYTNVDLYPPYDQCVDLSVLPWPWADASVQDILMLDFLEHFPYRQTDKILSEVWRVLVPEGRVEIQVPDFEHCAEAILRRPRDYYQCNACGELLDGDEGRCGKCKQSLEDIQDAAIHRLYGGQDRPGNWHHTAFTVEVLKRYLTSNGFHKVDALECDHQRANWNIKVQAYKNSDCWGEQ